MSKSIPRLEREFNEEVIALRQRINVLESEMKAMQEQNLRLVRAISDETLGSNEPPDLSGF